MKIDFTKCSNDDVAELMIAASMVGTDTHICYGIMNIVPLPVSCNSCITTKTDSRSGNDVCVANSKNIVSAPTIFRQCWEEIERRSRG